MRELVAGPRWAVSRRGWCLVRTGTSENQSDRHGKVLRTTESAQLRMCRFSLMAAYATQPTTRDMDVTGTAHGMLDCTEVHSGSDPNSSIRRVHDNRHGWERAAQASAPNGIQASTDYVHVAHPNHPRQNIHLCKVCCRPTSVSAAASQRSHGRSAACPASPDHHQRCAGCSEDQHSAHRCARSNGRDVHAAAHRCLGVARSARRASARRCVRSEHQGCGRGPCCVRCCSWLL